MDDKDAIATFADDSNSQIGQVTNKSSAIEEVHVQFMEDDQVSRISVYQKREQDQAEKNSKIWKCLVLPVNIVVGGLLLVDVVLGVVELVKNPAKNQQTPHWIIETFANVIITLGIAIGSQRVINLIKRKQELMLNVYGQD